MKDGAATLFGGVLRLVGAGLCATVAVGLVASALQLVEWWLRGGGFRFVVPPSGWWGVVGFWAGVSLGAAGVGAGLYAIGTRLWRRGRSRVQ